MKIIKKILSFIYHKTDEHTVVTLTSECLGYSTYRLYRIDKFIGFEVLRFVDNCNSLNKKRFNWGYNYKIRNWADWAGEENTYAQ